MCFMVPVAVDIIILVGVMFAGCAAQEHGPTLVMQRSTETLAGCSLVPRIYSAGGQRLISRAALVQIAELGGQSTEGVRL